MPLPPCVVCGRRTRGPSAGWVSVLTEAEAEALLGHAPPGDRSVVDPRGGARVWVGHEDCTGDSLRTFKKSGEELAQRLAREKSRRAPGTPGPRPGVRAGMTGAEVRRLLGPPHSRITGREYLRRMGAQVIALGGLPDNEYWVYRGKPTGCDTEITLENGKLVEVRTPRQR